MSGKVDMRIVASVGAFAVCVACLHLQGKQLAIYQPSHCERQVFDGGLYSNSTIVSGPTSCSLSGRQLHMANVLTETRWLNSLVQPVVPERLWAALPHVLQSWLRNYLLGMLEYLVLGFVWSYYIYQCFGGDLFPAGNMPTWSSMMDQAKVASVSMPLFSLLPTVIEALTERGYTMAYGHISDMGFARYLAYLFVYMLFVEFGIYWMHRLLHDIPAGYKYLHQPHHKYNKEHTMSPFAGLAFHPVDGILQAFPHLVAIMLFPTHFFTHEILLFMEAVWTANIHDNIHLNILPFMGAGWHTIHHTTYKHNYGHYFVLMDWFYGTLLSPEELAARERAQPVNGKKVL